MEAKQYGRAEKKKEPHPTWAWTLRLIPNRRVMVQCWCAVLEHAVKHTNHYFYWFETILALF